MLIERIEIDHIFQYGHAAVALKPGLNLVFGYNDQGKTNLGRVVELLLAGGVLALRNAGLTVDRMIRLGEKSGRVASAVRPTGRDKAVAIERKVTARGVASTLNGHDVTRGGLDYYAPPGLPDPDAVFRVLCNISGFFALAGTHADTAKRQKELLLQLVDQAVAEVLTAHLPAHPAVPRPGTLAGVEQAYDAAFKTRTDVGRALKATPPPSAEDLAIRPVDQAAIERKLGELEADERRLLQARGEQAGQRQALTARRGPVAEALERARIRLRELGDAKEARKRVETAETALAVGRAAEAAYQKADAELGTDKARLEASRRQYEKVIQLGKSCVISEEIECPLTKAKRQEIGLTWDKRMTALERSIQERQVPERPHLRTLQERLEDATKLVRELERHQGDEQRLAEELGQIDFALLGQDDAPEGADDVGAQLAEVQGRLAQGRSNREEAGRLNARHAKATTDHRKRSGLEAETATLTALCEAYGPAGIRERLLVERLGALTERVNAVLGHFGIRLEFVPEPWEIRINGVPSALMAESVLFRAGLAFQVAIGHVTGVKFLVADRADLLDGPNRGVFFRVLTDAIAQGWIDQAIVLATMQTEAALARPWPPAWGVYRIARAADGTSTITPVASAAVAA